MAVVEYCHWPFTFLLVLSLIYILDIEMLESSIFRFEMLSHVDNSLPF